MKYSNVPWVGEIPENWEIDRIKTHYYIISGSGFNVSLQGEDNGDYPIVKASDISEAKKYLTTAKNFLDKKTVINQGFKIVPKNSVLMAKIGEAMKKNNRAIAMVDCCLDNNCQGLVPKYNNGGYGYYLFNCINMQWFDNAGTIPCINNQKLLNFSIPVPPIAKQQKIADYLDGKCEEIDGLINDIKTQIETLEQYKRSVITEAVTKGLNKSAPMKDSGIPWIGAIPEKWKSARIGALYELRNQKVNDTEYLPLSVTMKGILPQLETVAKTNAHDDRKLVRKGDFAINSRSDRRGSCGISDYDGSVSLINTVLKPLNEMNPIYYNWLFHTVEFADEFYKWGHGIVDDLWTTGWQDMKNIVIPQPLINEQKQIADYLDKKCAEIDKIISDKQSQIETLEEYKKTLIFEYVTGKKQV